ncbi:MAG TPA: SMP-30/gluconolactonase/LRE family protein, partial [Acidimicrobiales bacterium]
LPPDGEPREVIFPLDAPNGIGLSPAGDRLYVAETHTGRLWAWDVTGPGEVAGTNPVGPGGGQTLLDPGGYTLFDSLAVDREGWVCVATLVHGGITAVSPDGTQVERHLLPDPLTTNICFGDDSTAYATLSGTGQLVAFDWPRHR